MGLNPAPAGIEPVIPEYKNPPVLVAPGDWHKFESYTSYSCSGELGLLLIRKGSLGGGDAGGGDALLFVDGANQFARGKRGGFSVCQDSNQACVDVVILPPDFCLGQQP